jgi:hypothetical protein
MPTDPLYDPTKKPVVTPLAGLADGGDDDEDPENRKRGDIACKHLFEQGFTAILDVRCVNLIAKSYKLKDPESVLRSHEMEKRRKYAAGAGRSGSILLRSWSRVVESSGRKRRTYSGSSPKP